MVVEEMVEHQLDDQQEVDEDILLLVGKKECQEENQMPLDHMESILIERDDSFS
jgi:hypothetical protein